MLKEKQLTQLYYSQMGIYLQLTPNNPFKTTAARYTGSVPFQLRLQSRDLRDYSHPAAHYVAATKKYWREEQAELYSLFERYYTSGDVSIVVRMGIDRV